MSKRTVMSGEGLHTLRYDVKEDGDVLRRAAYIEA